MTTVAHTTAMDTAMGTSDEDRHPREATAGAKIPSGNMRANVYAALCDYSAQLRVDPFS